MSVGSDLHGHHVRADAACCAGEGPSSALERRAPLHADVLRGGGWRDARRVPGVGSPLLNPIIRDQLRAELHAVADGPLSGDQSEGEVSSLLGQRSGDLPLRIGAGGQALALMATGTTVQDTARQIAAWLQGPPPAVDRVSWAATGKE